MTPKTLPTMNDMTFIAVQLGFFAVSCHSGFLIREYAIAIRGMLIPDSNRIIVFAFIMAWKYQYQYDVSVLSMLEHGH